MDRVGFFTNLATEMIGAFVTLVVLGVLLIVIIREEKQEVQAEIARTLGDLAIAVLETIPEHLGIAPQSEPLEVLRGPPGRRYVAEHAIGLKGAEITEAMLRLNADGIAEFARRLNVLRAGLLSFYDRNLNRLEEAWIAATLLLVRLLSLCEKDVISFAKIEVEAADDYAGQVRSGGVEFTLDEYTDYIEEVVARHLEERLHSLFDAAMDVCLIVDYFAFEDKLVKMITDMATKSVKLLSKDIYEKLREQLREQAKTESEEKRRRWVAEIKQAAARSKTRSLRDGSERPSLQTEIASTNSKADDSKDRAGNA